MDRLLAHLRLTAEASQSAKDRAVLDSGLTKAQYNAMLMLQHSGEATATQLARDCNISQQAMSQTVKRLREAEFITSQPSPHGGRALVLRLSDRGESSLATRESAPWSGHSRTQPHQPGSMTFWQPWSGFARQPHSMTEY